MPPNPDALALVHEGWDHLKHERPLAAWASWQRALRIDPDQPAARQALDRLANAAELPASARKEYRFRNPSDPARRARWDAAFGGRDLSDLATVASVFGELAEADRADPDAAYNQALCLAWLGRNVDAIGWLDESVLRGAATDFDAATSAWTLARVLSQGGGAEKMADEFHYTIEVRDDIPRVLEALARGRTLYALPSPAEAPRSDATVYEWFDRPWPSPREIPLRLDELPRQRAIVVSTAMSVRFSTTRTEAIANIVATLSGCGMPVPPIRQTPLGLAFVDNGLPPIRLPDWLEADSWRRLRRENVEDYFENRWIHLAQRGLDDHSPLQVSGRDVAWRARLEGTVRFCEEVAARPASAERFQGYPFDRLRRRLGLPPRDAEAIDAADASSMSGDDLDRLDPSALDDHTLIDAFRSAAALGNDARTARFADRLIAANSPSLARLDLKDVFAPLIRCALAEGHPEEALRRVDQAIAVDQTLHGAAHRAEFRTWRAELHARLGQPDRAESAYHDLIDHSAAAASVALDGAETLLDNGHHDQARRLAALARDMAREHGDAAAAREAQAVLDRLEQ
jgi:tetratricopeptide (TPR) repeat protein